MAEKYLPFRKIPKATDEYQIIETVKDPVVPNLEICVVPCARFYRLIKNLVPVRDKMIRFLYVKRTDLGFPVMALGFFFA